MKGEVTSQRVVVKQETEDEHCHCTPLTVSYCFTELRVLVGCIASLIQA